MRADSFPPDGVPDDGAEGGRLGGQSFPPSLVEVAAFLDRLLLTERFAGLDDPAGIWRPSGRPVAALGLALGAWPGIAGWVGRSGIDALLLHRPWGVHDEGLGEVGVLAYHLAFDERLTLGFNPALAAALGMGGLEVLGRKAGRPIGMIGDVAEEESGRFRARLAREFGGLEGAVEGTARTVARVAVVGAMTAPLIEEAARRGADVYVTGQVRAPARRAMTAAGLATVAVGHRRSEVWGLRALARALGERWPGLRLVFAPDAGEGGHAGG